MTEYRGREPGVLYELLCAFLVLALFSLAGVVVGVLGL